MRGAAGIPVTSRVRIFSYEFAVKMPDRAHQIFRFDEAK